ncbi:hypothetical protein E2P81_ATG10001 [Venturia nashicola]|nr:hypothetical protein E2P81_ATG10001 [Venturia nashicola]
MESASSSLTRSLGGAGERVSLGMDLRPTGDLGGEDRWIGVMASKEFGPHMRSRVHALMTEPSGAEGFLKPSFDVQKERELSTRVEPRPPRVLSVIDYEDVTDPVTKPEASRVSRFREELIIDEEDIADFERWKEMKRLDNQRYAAATQVANSDPRSPLQLPSTPMRNITDSMPRRFLRRIASFGPRRNSRGEEEEEGKEPELWKRQSATSLMKRVTSLSCLSVSGDNFAEAPTLESAPSVSSLTSPPTPVRTTIAVPPPIRPQRPVRSPLNFHAGRMEFEESNPFAYVEFQRPMDAFRGLKRWSWYNKPEGRSFNMDPNWDNAKKELGRLDVADAQILSIIADDEDMPEYVELIREIEKELTSRESRKDNGTSSPHMGIDLNNAPMILRHLEECREDALMPMIEARVLESIEGRDEVDVPVMLEEDDSDDSDEGVGSRSFDCAAALNGQMTFLISDSEDEGVEEEAVIGAYSSHRRYPRGK